MMICLITFQIESNVLALDIHARNASLYMKSPPVQ